MSVIRVRCPATIDPSAAERAMLLAVPLAMSHIAARLWCELDHYPDTGLDPAQPDTARGQVLHSALAQAGEDTWWLRWTSDGDRRELTPVPGPCLTILDDINDHINDDVCPLPLGHTGRHLWAYDPAHYPGYDPGYAPVLTRKEICVAPGDTAINSASSRLWCALWRRRPW